jgi:23S rRNA (adenine2503-C2)-methyltransferase
MEETRENIKVMSRDEIVSTLGTMGFRKYRGGQVFAWLYGRGAVSFEDMTDISRQERAELAERFFIPRLRLAAVETSSDGTRKFLFLLDDGHSVESVLIPDEDRLTLCISSQVGCGQACRFCLTGAGGFTRNLKAHEIVDQVVEVERTLVEVAGGCGAGDRLPLLDAGRRITNLVLMGMGEPLANYDEVVKALAIVTAEEGMGFSPRRVTLSTAGLVPEMEKLGRSGLKVNLAVSLNAATDEVRSRIMPVNRRYPLQELLAACRRYPLEPRRRITFEYVLLRGVNDREEDARRLVRLLHGIRCKINLIPFNPLPGSEFGRPDEGQVTKFQTILVGHHFTAPVRTSRGRDISAACGQLRERILTREEGHTPVECV